MKQINKSNGELQTSTIKFTKSTFEAVQPEEDQEDEIRRNRALLQAQGIMLDDVLDDYQA